MILLNLRIPFIGVFVFLLTANLGAQHKLGFVKKVELGVSTGPLFFLGDLGGNVGAGSRFLKDIDWPETKIGAGIQLNIFPSNWISIRTAFFHGAVAGNDIHSPNLTTNDIFRFNRNLHFRSRIDELSASLELYPLRIIPTNRKTILDIIQPYALFGVGLFHFNPQAKDIDNDWIDLHPLKLEGQGFEEYPDSKPYKLTQLNLQGGVGIKYYLNERTYVGVELLYRKLFTDQIDNVSAYYYVDPATFDPYLSPAEATRAKRLYYQGNYNLGGQLPHEAGIPRGNPDENDAYFGQTIHLGTTIFPSARDKRMKCPIAY
ncbi:MAG: hypothetical protein ACO3AY_04130 [Chitinophagaceae bacterium]